MVIKATVYPREYYYCVTKCPPTQDFTTINERTLLLGECIKEGDKFISN